MFETDETVTPIVGDIFRAFGSLLDRGVYALLEAVYRLFFKISTFELITGATVARFFGRIQLIFGIFIMFQLAMTILKGIVSPDTFTNEKTGAGSLIIKVITALLILTMLVPINFPNAKNEYEKQISNNGILFGTLYSLQNRVLANNLIGKVIFGTSEGNATLSNPDSAARVFTSTIMKGFYRINLKPENSRTHQDGKEDYMITSNRMCPNYDYSRYLKADVDPSYIASSVNEKCSLLGDKYAYAYTFFISFVVGIVFIVLFVSFTFDVVVRAAKLALLRLIAPIPVISYMDPSGSKDSAFNSWVKTLTSTYIDLFTRLATIYFVLYIIEEVGNSGLFATDSSIGIIGRIVVYIGLFIFAKQAPKFIKEVLGLKGDTGSLFGGLTEALGIAAIGVGTITNFAAGRKAAELSQDARGKDYTTLSNRGRQALSGLASAVTGVGTGAMTYLSAKDHSAKAVRDAFQKKQAEAIARGAAGTTFGGRIKSSLRQTFTGEGLSAEMERQIQANKSRMEALKAIKNRVSAEMIKQDWTSGSLGIEKDINGKTIGDVNFKDFEASLAAGRADGTGLVKLKDINGNILTITLESAEKQRGFLLKNNENDYIVKQVNGIKQVTIAGKDVNVGTDEYLKSLIYEADSLGGGVGKGSSTFVRNPDGSIELGTSQAITNRDSITKAIEGFENLNTQLNRENELNKANDRYSKKS